MTGWFFRIPFNFYGITWMIRPFQRPTAIDTVGVSISTDRVESGWIDHLLEWIPSVARRHREWINEMQLGSGVCVCVCCPIRRRVKVQVLHDGPREGQGGGGAGEPPRGVSRSRPVWPKSIWKNPVKLGNGPNATRPNVRSNLNFVVKPSNPTKQSIGN